jgi:hypothetical protein
MTGYENLCWQDYLENCKANIREEQAFQIAGRLERMGMSNEQIAEATGIDVTILNGFGKELVRQGYTPEQIEKKLYGGE